MYMKVCLVDVYFYFFPSDDDNNSYIQTKLAVLYV